MDEYNFLGDLLNKYSQLTPWVQTILGIGFCTLMLGLAYFIKESIAAIIKPFCRQNNVSNEEPKQEWKDKYYRDETNS